MNCPTFVIFEVRAYFFIVHTWDIQFCLQPERQIDLQCNLGRAFAKQDRFFKEMKSYDLIPLGPLFLCWFLGVVLFVCCCFSTVTAPLWECFRFHSIILRRVWKSGACIIVVGIICPSGWDRANCSAKNWGEASVPPPPPPSPLLATGLLRCESLHIVLKWKTSKFQFNFSTLLGPTQNMRTLDIHTLATLDLGKKRWLFSEIIKDLETTLAGYLI
jgi:hypothetical protein